MPGECFYETISIVSVLMWESAQQVEGFSYCVCKKKKKKKYNMNLWNAKGLQWLMSPSDLGNAKWLINYFLTTVDKQMAEQTHNLNRMWPHLQTKI